MAEIQGSFAVWHLRAEDVKLVPNPMNPRLLALYFDRSARIVLDRGAADTAEQAAAMRRLARLAAEAAEDLERAAAARPGDGTAAPV